MVLVNFILYVFWMFEFMNCLDLGLRGGMVISCLLAYLFFTLFMRGLPNVTTPHY